MKELLIDMLSGVLCGLAVVTAPYSLVHGLHWLCKQTRKATRRSLR
jgi:hypothetical protein